MYRYIVPQDLNQILALEKEFFNVDSSEDGVITKIVEDRTGIVYDVPHVGIVACILYTHIGDDMSYIVTVGVKKEYQGRGISKKLFSFLPKFPKTILHVHPKNFIAIKLYESLGFKAWGVEPNYFHDSDGIVMLKANL